MADELQLATPSIILVAGAPGVGKSHLIRHLVYTMSHIWSYGMAITPTIDDYRFMPRNYVRNIPNEGDVEWLMQKQKHPRGAAFLILDDVAGFFNMNSRLWWSLFTTYRHLNITIIFATQYVTRVPTIVREMANYVFMFKQNIENSYRLLHQSCGQYGFSKWQDFRAFLQERCHGHETILYIRMEEELNRKYRSYIAPAAAPNFRLRY